MADFQDTLQSILGNQEAMGQIMALARSLSGEESGAGEGPPPPPVPEREEPKPPPLGLGTAGLPDLTTLLGQVDPGLIQLGMRLFREYQGEDDRSAALLAALPDIGDSGGVIFRDPLHVDNIACIQQHDCS